MDEHGKTYISFGSGNSCDLGKAGEEALVRWVEELYVRGDEMLNIDETGFDLVNNMKTMRVIVK